MAVNTTVVEIVKFQANGLTEIQARTKAMGVEIANVTTRAETMARLLADPRFGKFTKRISEANAQIEVMNLKARNAGLASRLADGSEAKRLRTVSKLNTQYERMRREAELTAKYGERTGRFLSKYGGALGAAGGVAKYGAAAMVATGGALAHQGFQGTVEAARFQSEWDQLSREMATTFRPLMIIATRVAKYARKKMEAVNADADKANAFVGATLGVGLIGITARMMGTGAMLSSGWQGAKSAASLASRGVSALGRFAPWVYAATQVEGIYDDIRTDPSTIRAVLRQGPVRTADFAVGGELARMFGFKHGSIAGQIYNSIAGENPNLERGENALGSAVSRRLGGGAKPGGMTPVMLAGGGFQESGAGYEGLSAAIEKVRGGDADDEIQLGPTLKRLVDVLEQIERLIPGSGGEPGLTRLAGG